MFLKFYVYLNFQYFPIEMKPNLPYSFFSIFLNSKLFQMDDPSFT